MLGYVGPEPYGVKGCGLALALERETEWLPFQIDGSVVTVHRAVLLWQHRRFSCEGPDDPHHVVFHLLLGFDCVYICGTSLLNSSLITYS